MDWKEATLHTTDMYGSIVARVLYDRHRQLLKVTKIVNHRHFKVGANVSFFKPGGGSSAPMFRATITQHVRGSSEGEGGLYNFEG